MTLYDYLNVVDEEADGINDYESDELWEIVNIWSSEFAKDFSENDAVFIIELLKRSINEIISTRNDDYDMYKSYKIYARAYVFTNHPTDEGNELFTKCQRLVSEKIFLACEGVTKDERNGEHKDMTEISLDDVNSIDINENFIGL